MEKVQKSIAEKIKKVLGANDIVLLVSPRNHRDFSFDPCTMNFAQQEGTSWAAFIGKNDPASPPRPREQDILVFDQADEMARVTEDRIIYVFSDEDREALLDYASANDLKIDRRVVRVVLDSEELKKHAPNIADKSAPLFFTLGEEDHLGLDLPEDPNSVDHAHAMAYFSSIAVYRLDDDAYDAL